jgi:hypothetical protein
MRHASTTAWLVACAAVAALASPAAFASRPPQAPAGPSLLAAPIAPRADRGVVQSVSATGLVLKVLDGSSLTVSIDAKTRVFLDGRRVSILDVRPGFVAVVAYADAKRGQPATVAREVRAFSASTPQAAFAGSRGTAQSVSPGRLVLETPDGGTRAVPIDKRTRLLLNGKRASLVEIRPGFAVVVAYAGARPKGPKQPPPRLSPGAAVAQVVWAFSPGSGPTARLEQGVVQSVAAGAVALDEGAGAVRVDLDARTRVFVNGKASAPRDVGPGFVAVVRRPAVGPAAEIWAFGSSRA